MRRMSFTVLLALLLLPAATAWAKDALEGTWTVTVSPDDAAAGDKDYEDTLVFGKGKFTSTLLQARGFEPSAYEADVRGGGVAVRFNSQTASAKDGKAAWEGTATAGSVQGTYTWTKKDGSTVSYHFSGTKK